MSNWNCSLGMIATINNKKLLQYDTLITSLTSMSNEATFREILLHLSGSVNGYVAHI